jgi:hypothetical protein
MKQRDKNWCALACLESACVDFDKKEWTQETIDQKFSWLYPKEDGVFHTALIPSVCLLMSLGNCFHLISSKEEILRYSNRLAELVIFIATQKDGTGGKWGHCWRVSKADKNDLEVLEPDCKDPREFRPLDWGDLIRFECLVYVVGRSNL